MYSNSNQQKFTVSIRGKREQFRKDIRRERLEQMFKTKRIQLFANQLNQKPLGRFDYFKKLEAKILNCKQDPDTINEVQTEVKELFEKFPEESWNFLVLGNLLIKVPEVIFNFDGYIFREENIQWHSNQQFAWCLGVYLCLFCMKLYEEGEGSLYLEEIEKIDRFLGEVIQRLFDNLQTNIQTLNCIGLYLDCVRQILHQTQNQIYFPMNSFHSLVWGLSSHKQIYQNENFETRAIKISMTILFNEMIADIKRKQLYSNQYPDEETKKYIIPSSAVQKLMNSVAELFHESFRSASDERPQCLQSFKILSLCYPFAAGDFLFTQKNIEQLIFLMINHEPRYALLIMESFKAVLPYMSKSKIILLINNCFHINLVTLLQKYYKPPNGKGNAFDKYESNELLYTLMLIDILLAKVQEIDRYTFQCIFSKMQNHGFGDCINAMTFYRYKQNIEDLEIRLIDLYFSEEMDQEKTEQKQNFRDNSNTLPSQNSNKTTHTLNQHTNLNKCTRSNEMAEYEI